MLLLALLKLYKAVVNKGEVNNIRINYKTAITEHIMTHIPVF